MILYAATSNPGKLREFSTSASSAGIDVLPLPGLKDIPEPVEDAPTFMGNAELKAVACSLAAPGLFVFADDSGLEVDALHGEPGVRSARYADDAGYLAPTNSGAPRLSSETWASAEPPLSKDQRNNALLLERLRALPANTPRTAKFVCALALARDGHVLLRATSAVDGEILDAPRGTNGFGYDPLFLIPSLYLTTAELPADKKWSLSHRGRAFRSLLAEIAAFGL
ncbi:XTP/dITP diphosphohydrolase [Bryocella elongata]|uniref:dITP/XTP pyrophosphatase n=1 Tax=Bryocella elongata TaxID=863522 RepID=A0A1H6C1V3_9BACT|nr:non-canonical purine NTP pyrophosphatase [Bryocella elongata]SEG66990.1 XTP/dITP diphosphohydrolase [Bryocella elongata]